MKDEKKIEDAAKVVVEKEYTKDIPIIKNTFKNGFHKGIDWFLDSLWHDASKEIPKEKAELFVKLGNEYFSAYRMEDYYYVTDINNTCEVLVKTYEVTRWLYIDDLLKGGNNG